MAISHRLQSTMYKRPDEGVNEKPKRIVFLSMEGDRTEKDYFDLINKFRESLGIKSIVHIETLSRRDTRSDPKSVLALLDDSFKIQEEGITSGIAGKFVKGERLILDTHEELWDILGR